MTRSTNFRTGSSSSTTRTLIGRAVSVFIINPPKFQRETEVDLWPECVLLCESAHSPSDSRCARYRADSSAPIRLIRERPGASVLGRSAAVQRAAGVRAGVLSVANGHHAVDDDRVDADRILVRVLVGRRVCDFRRIE